MRAAWIWVILLLTASAARAEWPTTSYLPVPAPEQMVEDIIGGNLEAFAEDGTLSEVLVGQVNRGDGAMIIDVGELDFQAMRRGAIGALIDVMRMAAIDASQMKSAEFLVPLIEPLIRVDGVGTFFPLFWSNKSTAAGGRRDPDDPSDDETFRHPAWQACQWVNVFWPRDGSLWSSRYRNIIEVNEAFFPYSVLDAAWRAGGRIWERKSNKLTSTVIHETVHAIQRHQLMRNCYWSNPWITEGLADAVAHHLAAQRVPDLYNRYPEYRNDRRYDVSLDARQFSGADHMRYGYATGSFWRYFIEASGEKLPEQFAIIKRMLELPVPSTSSRSQLIGAVDDALIAHTGKRGLFQVLPEFLTEYASYGGTRYKKYRGRTLSNGTWLERMFLDCVELDITPSKPDSKSITVNALAGKCIRVDWSGFPYPVGLQLRAIRAGDKYGDLHLGEVRHAVPGVVRYCYDDVTKTLTNRLSRNMSEKCMLRRGTDVHNGKEVASWTSDLNMSGVGQVVYMISNVAKEPEKSEHLTFEIHAHALNIESVSGHEVAPAKTAGSENPVRQGLTDIETRLYTITGGGDRVLIDGRSVLGDVGRGYMESVPGAAPGDALFTLVRSKGYAIMWVGAYPKAGFNDAVFIYQDPMRILDGNVRDNLIYSAGMRGLEVDEDCGYMPMARVDLIEESEVQVVFRLTADLFRPLAAVAGAQDKCEYYDKIFVERVEFVITLPFGSLHSGGSDVKRGKPPGQEVYDEEEFPSGPSFGGILTSISLRDEGFPEPGDAGPGGPGLPSPGGIGRSIGMSTAAESCDCACPDANATPDLVCLPHCERQWRRCPGADISLLTAILAGSQSVPEPSEPTVDAQRRYLSRLIGDRSLPDEVKRMLVDDFAGMSAETRQYLLTKYRNGAD